MKKLFHTLCVLLAISSQADGASSKQYRSTDTARSLPFTQANQSRASTGDIADLYRVQAFQSGHLKQPYSEFSRLYQEARAGQNELEKITERIAWQSATSAFSSGVKSKRRAIAKIRTKLAGKSEQITDLARTSLVAKDVPALIAAFELLAQETELLQVKNRFQTPGRSGYRDLSLLIRLPESQIIAEVQLHLEAFAVIKNGQEHHNYEQIQAIERLQQSDNRALSAGEQAAVNKLRKASQQLYRQAWSHYLSA